MVLVLTFSGCDVKQDSPAETTTAATPTRDLRLEFGKLVEFLGTKVPKVYWLKYNSVHELDPQFVQADGDYYWTQPSKNGNSNLSISMSVTRHDFDSVQNLGTIVWTVETHQTTFDQSKWDSAVQLNELNMQNERARQAFNQLQGNYSQPSGAKGNVDPFEWATLKYSNTKSYKATYYFSGAWILQKVEISVDSSDYQIIDRSSVKNFFEEAMKTVLK
jgi:hypothetical protein